MPREIAAALREQTRVMGVAEKAVVVEVKQEAAAVASVLAQLAEKLERDRR